MQYLWLAFRSSEENWFVGLCSLIHDTVIQLQLFLNLKMPQDLCALVSELCNLGPSEAALEPQVSVGTLGTGNIPQSGAFHRCLYNPTLLCGFYLVTIFKMLNSKPAKLSQSCIVVMVFKAETSTFFCEKTSANAEFSAGPRVLLCQWDPGSRGTVPNPWLGLVCAQGFAQVTGSGCLSPGCSQRNPSWDGGGHLLRLFLHQILLIPKLPHFSQDDFKTHLGAEPLYLIQWEQHMAPLQCTFSPRSKEENTCMKIAEITESKARRRPRFQ